jgi:hypothetical protein
MGSAAVASWAAVIKDLQQLVEGDPAEEPKTAVWKQDRLVAKIFLASQQPQLPHAAWKKLVLQMKVRDA